MLHDKFVPVAIDQWYTRRQQDTSGEFYRQIAGQGPRSNFQQTTQGFYLADPAGGLLAYNNNRGPERIRALMEQALTRYQPPETTPLERENTDPRFSPTLPDGAVVVRVSAKVLDGYEATDDRWQQLFQQAVSRDNLWITAQEQQALLTGQFPQHLALRMARFHLVDNTRGEPPTWKPIEIQQLDFQVTDGQISGTVELVSEDGSRGFQAELSGQVSGRDQAIVELTMTCVGEYWGAGPFTRKPPEGKFPLAIAFQLADGNDVADSIPPHASRGWIEGYLNPGR